MSGTFANCAVKLMHLLKSKTKSPASLHVNAYQAAGLSTIYRYMYGAVLQGI